MSELTLFENEDCRANCVPMHQPPDFVDKAPLPAVAITLLARIPRDRLENMARVLVWREAIRALAEEQEDGCGNEIRLTKTTKHLLDVIGDRCTPGSCDWPLDDIAAAAAMSKRTVLRHYPLAEQLGLLLVNRRPLGNGRFRLVFVPSLPIDTSALVARSEDALQQAAQVTYDTRLALEDLDDALSSSLAIQDCTVHTGDTLSPSYGQAVTEVGSRCHPYEQLDEQQDEQLRSPTALAHATAAPGQPLLSEANATDAGPSRDAEDVRAREGIFSSLTSPAGQPSAPPAPRGGEWATQVAKRAEVGRRLLGECLTAVEARAFGDAIRATFPGQHFSETDTLAALGVASARMEWLRPDVGAQQVGLKAVWERMGRGTVERPSVLGEVYAVALADEVGGGLALDEALTALRDDIDALFNRRRPS